MDNDDIWVVRKGLWKKCLGTIYILHTQNCKMYEPHYPSPIYLFPSPPLLLSLQFPLNLLLLLSSILSNLSFPPPSPSLFLFPQFTSKCRQHGIEVGILHSQLSNLGSNLDPDINCHPGVSPAGRFINVCAVTQMLNWVSCLPALVGGY